MSKFQTQFSGSSRAESRNIALWTHKIDKNVNCVVHTVNIPYIDINKSDRIWHTTTRVVSQKQGLGRADFEQTAISTRLANLLLRFVSLILAEQYRYILPKHLLQIIFLNRGDTFTTEFAFASPHNATINIKQNIYFIMRGFC